MPACQLHVLTDKLSQGEEGRTRERENEREQGLSLYFVVEGKKMKANMKKMALSFEIKG